MFPIKDDIPSSRIPFVTILLVLSNAAVFFHEWSLGAQAEQLVLAWGVVPVKYTHPEVRGMFEFWELVMPLFGSMFLHGGWTHLIGNMWTLWIFGDNVEDRVGHARFLMLYVAGGVIAALMHVFTNTASPVPTIGASGAVAAIMGGYFRFFPRARVLMAVPPFFLGPFFALPAVLFLGWWFVMQFFNGTLSLMGPQDGFGGIAWWAHIGGFVFGAFVCALAPTRRAATREDRYEDDYLD